MLPILILSSLSQAGRFLKRSTGAKVKFLVVDSNGYNVPAALNGYTSNPKFVRGLETAIYSSCNYTISTLAGGAA